MSTSRAYDPNNRDEVFDTLRREILAARVKVDLDQALKRETSEKVKRLAGMKLPPIVQPRHDFRPLLVDTEKSFGSGFTIAGSEVSSNLAVVEDHPAHRGYAKQ